MLARAKINLYLHVVGRRPDGFHLLDSLVVFAEAGVQPGPEPPSALPHDDRAAGDEVAVVRLHAEALRIGIASVA